MISSSNKQSWFYSISIIWEIFRKSPLSQIHPQIFQEPKKANQVEQVLSEFSRCIQVKLTLLSSSTHIYSMVIRMSCLSRWLVALCCVRGVPWTVVALQEPYCSLWLEERWVRASTSLMILAGVCKAWAAAASCIKITTLNVWICVHLCMWQQVCGDGRNAVSQHQIPWAAGKDGLSGQTPGESLHGDNSLYLIIKPGTVRSQKYWRWRSFSSGFFSLTLEGGALVKH